MPRPKCLPLVSQLIGLMLAVYKYKMVKRLYFDGKTQIEQLKARQEGLGVEDDTHNTSRPRSPEQSENLTVGFAISDKNQNLQMVPKLPGYLGTQVISV